MRKQSRTILIVIFIILSIGLIVYLGNGGKFAVTGCRLNFTGISPSSFFCPSDRCSIIGDGICNDQNPNSYVIFRTSTNTYNSGWVSLDINNDGSLEGFAFSNTLDNFHCSYPTNAFETTGKKTPEGYDIAKYTGRSCSSSKLVKGDVIILVPIDYWNNNVKIYRGISNDAITLSLAVSGYANKETYSSFLYSCTSDLKKGNTTLQTKSYAGNTVGSMLTNQFELSINEGVTFDKYNIKYTVYDCGACGECQIGTKSCQNETVQYECTSDIEGCGKKVYSSATLGYKCYNGEFVKRTGCKWSNPSCGSNQICNPTTYDGSCVNTGCDYPNNPGYIAPDTTNFETCINNQIVCIQDANTCTQAQKDTKKCVGDKEVYKCIQHKNCYRWEKQSTCSTNDFCNSGTCTPTYPYVGIIGKEEFQVDEQIKDIIIDITSNVAGSTNIPVTAFLSDLNGNEIIGTRISGITTVPVGDKRQANLIFTYSHPRSEDIKIVAIVGTAPIQYTINKTLHIKKTLQITPYCLPNPGIITRDITCNWEIKEKGSTVIFSVNQLKSLGITLTQGGMLPYTSITNGIKFNTPNAGQVTLRLVAEKDGYATSDVSYSMDVQGLTTSMTLLIDNKDFYEYPNGITQGSHQLEIRIEESGLPADILNIDATVGQPSGCPSTGCPKLIFNKISKGVFRTSYTFQQASNTYPLSVTAIFTDVNKGTYAPTPYNIVTTQTPTNDLFWLYVSIGAGIVALIIIIVITVYFIARRK